MPYLLNAVYLLALALASPWLVYRALTTGRYRHGLGANLRGRTAHPRFDAAHPRTVWFHGVSVGEIHLLRHAVAKFRERNPAWQCVVSTTTDTGYEEAAKSFPDLPIVYWPFDFTWAVNTALRRIRPRLVVLGEGELWPNFVRAAKAHGVKLAIINARMSPRSAARYRRFRRLVGGLFAPLDLIAAQNDEYRRHYETLGATAVHVTGNVKYDGVQGDRANPRTQALAELLGIRPGDLVWVAGSTQDPEERLALEIYAQAKRTHPNLRLLLVPRHRERFDEVAALLERSGLPFARRSRVQPGSPPPADAVLLADSMGELSALWGLADVAFVGGSLDGQRGGQNMIEPAAYGSAVLFGPHTWNFKETVTQLLAREAAVQVADAEALGREVLRLLGDAAARERLGHAAAQFVRSQQGATARTLELLERLLADVTSARRAA